MGKMKNTKRSDGRVKSKIYLGNGKYKYVYASNNRELEAKVQEVKLKLGKGIDVTAERDTFGEWAERWLKLKKTEVSEKRYEAYFYALNKLTPIINIPISKIRPIDIQDIITDLAASGLAYQTLSNYRSLCKQVMQLAIDNRVMDYNPASSIKIPKTAKKETERRALTDVERSWISAPTDHRGQLPAMIMLYAGLRRGELLALTWRDIDLDHRTITINKSVKMVKGRPVVQPHGKTEAATRVIRIPQILVDYLSNQKRDDNFIVCTDTHGNIYTEQAWKVMWESYIREINFKFGDFTGIMITDKKTGKLKAFERPKSRFAPVSIPMVIPPITAHWLRHTFITMMYLAGVDVLTAKEQAGHADIETTLQIYTHLDGQYKIQQINKLDEYLNASNNSDGGHMGVKLIR